MTRTRQDKTATPGAVELNDAALDRAAGGIGETVVGIDFRPAAGFYGTGVYKSVASGKT